MAGVFINYRNQDEPFAAALVDRELADRFGADVVFRASRSVEPGDFQPQILNRLRDSSVLLAIIGSRWVQAKDRAGRRRIDDPADWVRREIELAFTWGIRVIPVLVNSQMPLAVELPESLAKLVVQNYARLHHRTVETDLGRLARMVEQVQPELAFSDLVERAAKPRLTRQPSTLLDPHDETVKFRDRSGDIGLLSDWCGDPDAEGGMLLTGTAGVGKTRLAVELCKRKQKQGWIAGFVPRSLPTAALSRLESALGRALLVFDQAETRVEQVEAALTAIRRRKPRARRVVVLLLARSAGEWCDDLRDPDWGTPLAPYLRRHSIADPVGDATEFALARRGFAAVLGKPATTGRAMFPTALDAHLAALAEVLGASEGITGLLHQEYNYWADTRELYELPDAHRGRREQVIAAACLFGARDDAEALRTLAVLPTFRERSTDVLQRYADWARAMYPGPGALNAMGSEAMTEAHIAAVLARPGSLIGMLAEVSDTQAIRALSLLTAGAERRSEFARHLVEALRLAPARLFPLAVVTVPTAYPAGPLVAAMTEVLPGLSAEALDTVAAALPKRSLTLGPFALLCEKLSWTRHRDTGGRLAAGRFAMRFAARATYLGEHVGDAAAAAADAVALLAESGQAADIAESWAVLALVHDEHDLATAIDAGDRAIGLFRTAGSEHIGGLVTALHNQSVRLRGSSNRRAQARAAAIEAAEAARVLVGIDRPAYLSQLADILDNLSSLSDPDEGAAMAEEAVGYRRELAKRRPDAYLSTLATTLNTLGRHQADRGETARARETLTEALDLLVSVADSHPGRFDRELDIVRINLAGLAGESDG